MDTDLYGAAGLLPGSHLRTRLRRTSQPGFYRAAPMAGRPCLSRRNNMKPDGKNGTAHLPSSISKTEIGHFYFCLCKNKNGQEKVF